MKATHAGPFRSVSSVVVADRWGGQFVVPLPGDAQGPWRKVTSATAELLSAHEQAAGSRARICLEKFTRAFLRVSHQTPALASPKDITHPRAGKYARSGAETVGIPAEGAALAEGE